MPDVCRRVFVAGATGYMGRGLSALLAARGHEVCGLVRAGSEARAPAGCALVVADALDGRSYAYAVRGFDTFVHLVGVAHPSPAKAAQFRTIDLVSMQQAVPVAVAAGVRHFVYVSVAQPAPLMRAYQEVRRECEDLLGRSGLDRTVLRPWYVLGPGHRWPVLLVPFYKICEWLPPTRAGARRLGLVTIGQMLAALVAAVEAPARGVRVVDVPGIRAAVARP